MFWKICYWPVLISFNYYRCVFLYVCYVNFICNTTIYLFNFNLFADLAFSNDWVLLNRAPTSTHLHPPPPSSFQPPPSSLQHPQQYLSQNIAHNWTISPNLGQKIKSCPFWLKIGTRGILEVVIPNPGLDFWNSGPKIHFWTNLGPKIKRCPLCPKIGTHSISRMLIPNPHLDFWNSDPKNFF